MVFNKVAHDFEKERPAIVLKAAKKLLAEKKKKPFYYKYFRLHTKTQPKW